MCENDGMSTTMAHYLPIKVCRKMFLAIISLISYWHNCKKLGAALIVCPVWSFWKHNSRMFRSAPSARALMLDVRCLGMLGHPSQMNMFWQAITWCCPSQASINTHFLGLSIAELKNLRNVWLVVFRKAELRDKYLNKYRGANFYALSAAFTDQPTFTHITKKLLECASASYHLENIPIEQSNQPPTTATTTPSLNQK